MRTILFFALAQIIMLSVQGQTPTVNAIKTSATITIDGNLNEAIWQTTTPVAKTIIGTPNNTGTTFSVAWNSTYLYIGMKVTDANLFNESTNTWDDDAFEIYIDADNNGGTTYGVNDRQFMKEWNSTTIWEKGGKTTGVLHAWAAITGGYTVEVAIPWSNIAITNPAAGLIIGFDIANDDDDNGDVRESQRMWAGDGDNWQYTRNFGDLVLQNAPDTQAPTAPTNLASSSLTQSSLTLTWTASTDNVAVTGYDVYRNGGKINTTLITTTTYAVTGLTAATAYQFYVNAKDAAGNTSPNSTTITVTTPDTQAPTAPTGLAASNITQTTASLSWTASTDNVGVTGYDVYQNGVKINTALVTTTSYAVTGLTAGTAYPFYVRAKDAAGNTSANSNTITVTTVAGPDTTPPTAPSNLTASNLTQSSLTLNWTAATDNIGVTGYNVYQDGIKLNTSLITTTTYNVTGLTVLTNYQFYVTAGDAAGNTSSNSTTLAVTTPDTQAPTAPAGLSISNIIQSSVTLTWAASTDNVGVAGYDVYRNGVKINSALIAATTFDVTGLNAATSYQFYVTAKDAAGNTSANSATVSILTPDTQAPTAPANLAASALTQSSLTLTWTAATDNVGVSGYDVYQDGIKLNTAAITTTTYNVTGLTVLTAYQFYVIAKDAAGNTSPNSATITVTTPDTQAPTAPTGLTSSNLTQSAVTLSWIASTDNVGVAGYDVYRNGVKINSTLIGVTTYDITGLNAATAYQFYVTAKDAAGNTSANSAMLGVTTPDTQAPTAPTNLTASGIAQTSLTLTWTVSTDNVAVTGYDVYRNGAKINTAVVTTASYSVTGLTAATAYSFYVQARDAAGNLSVNSNTINVTTTAASTTCSGNGAINFQRWDNITGTAVANLTASANYPNTPTSSGTYTTFEAPSNITDNFGLRIWGYICPPTTGAYTFWIASDDNGELWLSTTNSAANKVKIAYHTSYTASREWNKIATQKSVAITLNAGQLYYVEALMKDGTQGDNLAVGWAKPGQATTTPSEVIPGTQLRTSLPDAQAPAAPTNLVATSITTTTFTLGWTAATDNIGVTGYDIYQNGIKINTANVTATSYAVTGLTAATTYSYYVVAKDAAGNLSPNSSTLVVTTATPPPPDTQAPTAPTGLAASILTQTSFTLKWIAATDNVAVTGYDVFRNGVKINTANITGIVYNVTGLTASTTYQFTVKAKDAAGNTSAASAILNVTTLDNTAAVETFTQRTVIANQRMPHDLVYGPDGNIWYTERFGGTVSFVNPATSVKRVVLTLGSKFVNAGGQDGLMGLALHPQFRQGKPYAYISYSYQSVSSTVRKIRIERYTYDSVARTLGSPVTILENIPGSNDHNSARLAIGPDLKLYFSIGDMGAGQFDNSSRPNNAQNLTIYEGKILRLNTELVGTSWIPTDNPFTNAGQVTAVYSYGHRNPQGLVWGNVNGTDILYSSEHGPYSDDELNIIQSGKNYGWPLVAGFCDNNYNGRYIGGVLCVNEQNNCNTINAKEPIRSLFPATTPGDSLVSNMTWPSTAPSGTTFYGSNAIPGWQNSLLVAMLKTGTVTRFKLSSDGMSIISDTIHYFRGKGRFRDVVVSPDGLKIYVACDSSGATSGPTGGVVSTPANPGSILEFTYKPSGTGRSSSPLITDATQEVKQEAAIEEDKSNKTIDVYPNPATDFFVVYNYNKDAAFNIELIDMNGRIVKRSSTKGVATRVEVSGLTGGVYILKLKDAEGKLIRAEKIIINK